MVTQNIYIAILTKLFLLILILYFLEETNTKSKLLANQSLQFSKMKSLALAFVADAFITALFFKILNVYI